MFINDTVNTLLKGIAHTVDAKVSIGGRPLFSFETLELKQSTARHHEFTIRLDKDLQNPAGAKNIDVYTQQYLGQHISITFYYKDVPDSSPQNQFAGIVTSVNFEQEEGYYGSIVLKGYSPTIVLDDPYAPHIQSFSKKSLQNIVQTILQQGGEAISKVAEVKPVYDVTIPYSCQYNETHYNYLCRLAAGYGEWMYYDGSTLFFGKPKTDPDIVKLVYGRDVRKVNIATQVRHTGNRKFDYDALGHTDMRVSDNKDISGLDLPGEIAMDISQKVFKTDSRNQVIIRSDAQNTIDNNEAYERGAAATDVFTVQGTTTVPLLHPCCKIELHMQDALTAETEPVTTFLVTECTHTLDRKNHYSCTFKGIPSKVEHLPQPHYSEPVAAPQLATVVSNEDEVGIGRVQVQFAWQVKSGETTHFIRVMTPDAGSSDNVHNNRGFVFVPEPGDQALIGFEYNHPDRPYVMGNMFHGQNGAGGFVNNHIKSIITRSGCTIQLDDTDGQGSITVKDPSGNSWYMDGKGNIKVKAPKNISIEAGENVLIEAGANINATAKLNITESAGINHASIAGAIMTQNAGADYTLMAANIKKVAKENISTNAKAGTKQAKEDINISSQNGNVNKHAQKQIQNNSGEKSLMH